MNWITIKSKIPKTIGCLVGGIVVSIVILTNGSTYSWFTSSFDTSIEIRAASTKDIIGEFSLISPNNIDPVGIQLKKAATADFEPIIFFEVKGDAKQYIMHINPVVLGDTEVFVPIELKVLPSEIKGNNKENVEGTITIKYLNNFISESIEFELTWDYLKNPKKINNFDEYITDSIISLAGLRSWNESSQEIGGFRVNQLHTLEDVHSFDDFGYALTLSLSSDQYRIMDVIFPTLRNYISSLQNYINTLLREISILKSRVADLESENEALRAEVERISRGSRTGGASTINQDSDNKKIEDDIGNIEDFEDEEMKDIGDIEDSEGIETDEDIKQIDEEIEPIDEEINEIEEEYIEVTIVQEEIEIIENYVKEVE